MTHVNKTKLFLTVQSVLCVLLAIMLIAAVIDIYCDGSAAQAENPLTWIFSREIVAERFRPIAPLFFAAIVLAAAGLILGVRGENALKPGNGGKVENKTAGGKTLQTVLLITAIILIAAGLFNGSARDVFGKAVRICAECVGLG